jgi:DNA-binding XRE family transcriptional regulator
MTESLQSDTTSSRRRTERTLLDVTVYDALALAAGLDRIEDQAAKHKVRRQHWSAIRNGHKDPSASLALRVADDLGVQPKAIWRREQVLA